MLRTVVPKVASAAAAVGTSASISHVNTVLTDHQPSLSGREVLSIESSRTSSNLSDCPEGWNIVHNGSSSIFATKPSMQETSAAATAVFEALDQVSTMSSAHSWPDADASMAASEDAISAANQALQVASGSTQAIRTLPMSRILQLVQNQPQETKHLVQSLTTDSKVWNAITQNPAFQQFLTSAAEGVPQKVEEKFENDEADPDTIPEKKQSGKPNGEGKFQWQIKAVVENVISGLNSVVDQFTQFIKNTFNSKEETDKDASNASDGAYGAYAGVLLLVMVVIGVIFARRAA